LRVQRPGPGWLRPEARLTVLIRQQCSIIAQMSELNTPLAHWFRTTKPNDAYSSQCVWEAILKLNLAPQNPQNTPFRDGKLKKISGGGTPPLGASILAPSALVIVSRFFSQNIWHPYLHGISAVGRTKIYALMGSPVANTKITFLLATK
jgi:hypothetical protein